MIIAESESCVNKGRRNGELLRAPGTPGRVESTEPKGGGSGVLPLQVAWHPMAGGWHVLISCPGWVLPGRPMCPVSSQGPQSGGAAKFEGGQLLSLA